MDKDSIRYLYQKVINRFGLENRLDHLQEECCEYALERNHLRRGRININKLIEEMVDVEIIMDQIKMCYPGSIWCEIKNTKLERLKGIMRDDGVMKIKESCMSCGQCVDECMVGAIKEKPRTHGYSQYEIDPDICIDCGNCVEVCPAEAITV